MEEAAALEQEVVEAAEVDLEVLEVMEVVKAAVGDMVEALEEEAEVDLVEAVA